MPTIHNKVKQNEILQKGYSEQFKRPLLQTRKITKGPELQHMTMYTPPPPPVCLFVCLNEKFYKNSMKKIIKTLEYLVIRPPPLAGNFSRTSSHLPEHKESHSCK